VRARSSVRKEVTGAGGMVNVKKHPGMRRGKKKKQEKRRLGLPFCKGTSSTSRSRRGHGGHKRGCKRV